MDQADLVSAAAALGVGVNKAAPHVKSKLSDLKSKLNRRANDTVETTDLEAEPEQADIIRLGCGSNAVRSLC
jgi:hypothetical protein